MDIQFIAIVAVCAAVFLAVLLFMLVLHNKSKAIYADYLAPLSEKEFRLKRFLHIGLFANVNIDLTKPLPYEIKAMLGRRRMEHKAYFIELYGAKFGDYYFTNHEATKTTGSLLVELFAMGFALLLCAQGDPGTAMMFAILGTLAALAAGTLIDSGVKTRVEARRLRIRMEFPEFVNKLVLLVNSGMTVSIAWDKIVTENRRENPLYDELKYAQKEIKDGLAESVAFEAFGRRCKTKEIMKFVSVIVSNLRRGGPDMVLILMQLSNECWEMRKNTAKELGAQAGVKMMLPMVMLLVAIIIVVGAPAIMMMSGI